MILFILHQYKTSQTAHSTSVTLQPAKIAKQTEELYKRHDNMFANLTLELCSQ